MSSDARTSITQAPTTLASVTRAPTSRVREHVQALRDDELPAYVYDLVALRDHVCGVRTLLGPDIELYYAAKANPDPAILRALGPLVDGYEVASGGELAHVTATMPGHPVALGGPGKSTEELRAALQLGVDRLHVESLHELHRLGFLAGQATPVRPVDLLLRVNVPVPGAALAGGNLAMGGRPTPFGLDPQQADEAVHLLASGTWPGLRLWGVHTHLASGLSAPEHLAVATTVLSWARDLGRRHDVAIDEVVVGGGMAVDYTSGQDFDWAAYAVGVRALAEQHPGVRIRLEPGRALTAGCGYYATEVIDVKPSHGEEFAVVRGGTHHLRTPATKGHDQPCSVVPVERWAHPWPRPALRGTTVTVCGQLCTPKDQLAAGVAAPGLRAGDRVVFAMAGAYAWNISHHDFLMHPHPSVHHLG